MTSKLKGNIALGNCIQFATKNHFIVSLPLTDAQDYDIIIDDGHSLLKVQVKYTGVLSDSGNYVVDTRVRGHKDTQGQYYTKDNVEPADIYFITTADNINYFIPYGAIQGKQTFTLNETYEEFLVR